MENIGLLIQNYLEDLPYGAILIENRIQSVCNDIRNSKSFEDAMPLFKILDEIQFILAKAVFIDGVEVSPFLSDFIYDFDRIDDDRVKVKQYNKIKSLLA
jgi:hypothetical protein